MLYRLPVVCILCDVSLECYPQPVKGIHAILVMMSQATILTNQIIDFVYRKGGYAWRASSTGIFDGKQQAYRTAPKKGVADVLAVVPPTGRMIAIEVKIGKDRLSPEQEGFLKNIAFTGGLSVVVKDFEEFKEWWDVHSQKGRLP